ncbi:MAG: tRNA (cytidine(56)-2'-O)-methyltransferase [archaeon]|nr:tRNA (cytidine(56)-2'-O)-methyltransferase [archaeon]
MIKEIVVLRYGHRYVRDYRVTSHCCLVARAFGANKVEVIGDKDESIENTVNTMNKQWGKGANVEFFDSWRKRITHYKQKGFTSVHLTMYGLPVQETEQTLRGFDKLLVIIGSQKVEKEVYEMADYNVSVTLQPHSEIAAMAVFLDRLQEGKELAKKFAGAKINIEPMAKGKKVSKK